MNRFNRKLNNKGVSLLLVIMTMTIVSVLAAIILALTYRNLKNMHNGIQSANSFYSAETAMDEMRAKFYEWSDEALRVSYERWVQSYNLIPADKKEIMFKQEFVGELENVLNDKFMCYFGATPKDIGSLFESFESDRVSWNETITPSLVKIDDDTKMKVKDISLKYTDKAGYQTVITTDLDLEVKYTGFSTNVIESSNENCAYYSIITDSQIMNDIGTVASVDGNIYAGGYNWSKASYSDPGIVFDHGGLNIYADKIISRNDIEFKNGAILNAKGIDGRYDYTGDLSLCNIWASGLKLTGTDGASTMKIQGNCYVNDDTTIDSKESVFEVNGSYYGYNTNNAAENRVDADNIELRMGTPDGSSSIVVNGAGAKVDLTKCDPLWIAGKSFVSVPQYYGQPEILDTNVAFPQGESISYRASQSAYLLPGDCITGIGHNPMTESEYNQLKDASNTDVDIDIHRSVKNGGVNLVNYLRIDKPYRAATVSYSAGETTTKLVYLYLNFISTEKATEYFQEYFGKYGSLVDSKVSMLGDGKILFNPLSLVTTGNVIKYDPENTNDKVDVIGNTDTSVDEQIEKKESELNEKFTGLITALDEDYTGVGVSQFLSDSFVDFSKVQSEYKDIELDRIGLNGKKYHLITGSDIVLGDDETGSVNAIIISSGTVKISNNYQVNGLIIAKDDVIMQNGKVIAQPDEVSDLILYNGKVAPLFMLDAEGGSGTDIDGTYSSDLFIINYDNWKKN